MSMLATTWTTFSDLLLSPQAAALPVPMLMRVALHVGWALVLGWGMLALMRRCGVQRTLRLALLAVVMLWALLPGATSPAYWLGLAFQTPSLMTMLICSAGLWQGLCQPEPTLLLDKRTFERWSLLGIALGWLLLLDTLALLPGSLYRWGFSPIATLLVAACAGVLWSTASFEAENKHHWTAGLPWLAVALFVLTRLPNGNVWDALIDPWLWAVLQLIWIGSGVRWLRRLTAPV